jgi:hypothetical protein
MSPATPYSGGGGFFTMTFEVLSTEDTQSIQLVGIALSNNAGQAIYFMSPDGAQLDQKVSSSQQTTNPIPSKGAQRHLRDFKIWWLTVAVPHMRIRPQK